MQNNLVFLCGPHGSGKTTLVDFLKRGDSRFEVPQLYSRNVKFNIPEEFQRQSLKIASRAIENFEYCSIAKENPEKIILANRCVYDVEIYTQAYFERGWLDVGSYTKCMQMISSLFLGNLSEPRAIVLNPGFDVCLKHLEKRWKEKGKKWREDDLEYAALVCNAYDSLKSKGNIYYVDHEIKLGDKKEFGGIIDWIFS